MDETDTEAAETDTSSSSESGIVENAPTLNSDARAQGRDDDSSTPSNDDSNDTS